MYRFRHRFLLFLEPADVGSWMAMTQPVYGRVGSERFCKGLEYVRILSVYLKCSTDGLTYEVCSPSWFQVVLDAPPGLSTSTMYFDHVHVAALLPLTTGPGMEMDPEAL